jgi:DNA-binding response OmpR family regulator
VVNLLSNAVTFTPVGGCVAREHRPDLVLMDIQLPDIEGNHGCAGFARALR